jgi:hypothetical protein
LNSRRREIYKPGYPKILAKTQKSSRGTQSKIKRVRANIAIIVSKFSIRNDS